MKKGDFSKGVVRYCIITMTVTLVWAMVLATLGSIFSWSLEMNDVLIFAGAFFGGELCLLALKRIFAKEREENDSDSESIDESDTDC